MTAIYIETLSKSYHSVPVVDNISLRIETGEQVALLGPNGAGKTTTIKMICGLIQPSAGKILINGHPPGHRREVMQKLGVMLEGARNIYWRLSPWNNLMYFASLKGLPSTPEVKTRAEYLLTELDLWDRRHDEVRLFSRGMQQKVAVACSLIADPDIVLLDEPTLGLDVQAYESITAFIKNLKSSGKTVLITSHQFDFIRETTERVIVMKQRIVFDGSRQAIAESYGGSYLVKVGREFDVSPGEHWQILHQNAQETTFVGHGDLSDLLNRIQEHHCKVKSVEAMSLTAEIFLDILERNQT
ncbi:MAG TPA: ABC transporter ATP-binding protein [Aggregatilineales bacterium]|nr:ABC transporter ATP-binding protein [Aggregatilineales bacterium]